MELKSFLSTVGLVKVKSIIDPLFVVGFLLLVLSVGAGYGDNVWQPIAFFVLGVIFLSVGLWKWLYFSKHNPNLLRSEDHQLKSEIFHTAFNIGDKDAPLKIENLNAIGKIITNPYLKALPEALPKQENE